MRSTPAIQALLIMAALACSQPAAAQAPGPGAAPSQPQATTTQPSSAKHVLQPKSKEEYDAYQAAAAETDPAKLEAAADAFAQKFPTSDLRAALYVRDMSLYQHANNAEKVIEVGRKAIALDPTNPVPLVNVASALAETTHDNDLDREQRLDEAAKDAHAAIANLDTGLQVPPNVSPQVVAQVKASILAMSYDTLGVVEMNKKDFAAAEQDLQRAVDASKDNPEGVIYLRLSVAQDNLKKYPQALESANKAIQYSPEGSAEQNLAKQQQARIQKLISAQGPASAGGTPAPAPSQPPVSNAPTTSGAAPPPQPH